MPKKRLINCVVHTAEPHYSKVSIIDLALQHAESSQPGQIPTIIDVNNALRAGSGGSWFRETWEACWLTPDEYAEFARRAKRREAQFQREKGKLERKR